MRVLLLRQRHFRNLALAEYRPPPGLSALVGGNAQGKTSLLWALHLALGGELGLPLGDLIRFGEGEAWLWAEVETALGRFRLEQRLGPEGRRFFLNGEAVGLRAFWELPGSVLAGPVDLEALLGGKEERRRFLDRILLRFSRRYAGLLSAYERALRQRNALLREGRLGALPPWDQELARYGEEILALRRRFLRRYAPLVGELHRALGGGEVELRLAETAPEGELLRRLEESRPQEAERGQTLVGPHRDEFLLLLDGRPLHRFASRGEAKGVALALRLAEHRLLWLHHEEPPLLLLDEWGEELDAARRQALLTYAQGLPQAILAGLSAPEGVPVCWMEGGVVLCPGAG